MNVRVSVPERLHCATVVQGVLVFGQWMSAQQHPEDVRASAVTKHFPLSTATAYRWLNAWRAVYGLPSLGETSPFHRNRMRKQAR